MNIYKSKWTRTIMRILSIIGLIVCLFFVAVGLFQMQPLFNEWKVLEPVVVLILLGFWLISMLLNNLSSIDIATKKARFEEGQDKE